MEPRTSPQVAARALLTERTRAEVPRGRVGEDGASVAAVAREFGIGRGTAMAAVRAPTAGRGWRWSPAAWAGSRC